MFKTQVEPRAALEFWTFYDVISMIYKSVDYGKLWSICEHYNIRGQYDKTFTSVAIIFWL